MSLKDPVKLFQFLQEIGKLKSTKRTGWVLRNVKNCESVADHMYRMAIMSLLLDDCSDINRDKCIKLSLIHDMAECIVGDLTPCCGVDKEEKHRRENEAMLKLIELIGNSGEEVYSLYKEYETQSTKEAKLVKEFDRLDMILQAFDYEKSDNRPGGLQEFFDSVEGKFEHPVTLSLVQELNKKRKEFEDVMMKKEVTAEEKNG